MIEINNYKIRYYITSVGKSYEDECDFNEDSFNTLSEAKHELITQINRHKSNYIRGHIFPYIRVMKCRYSKFTKKYDDCIGFVHVLYKFAADGKIHKTRNTKSARWELEDEYYSKLPRKIKKYNKLHPIQFSHIFR